MDASSTTALVSIGGKRSAAASAQTTSGKTSSFSTLIAMLCCQPLRTPYCTRPIPKIKSALGPAMSLNNSNARSTGCGNSSPASPNTVPNTIPATKGLVMTPNAIFPMPSNVKEPCFAHSMEIDTRVHNVNALNTMTSAADGTASGPSVILTSGSPSKTLLEKIPPIANTDCATPSSLKKRAAMMRPRMNTTKQPPKNATSTLGFMGGSEFNLLIKWNSIAGKAMLNTNLDASAVQFDRQRGQSAST